MSATSMACFVYVGTYSRNGSEGVYIYRLDPATGGLTSVGVGRVGDNPSFVAIHPSGKYLYAVNEVKEFQGQPGGGLTSFALDRSTGALTLLNQQPTRGAEPCHVTVDASGRYALVANYGGGSVAMLPIAEDGTLSPASDFWQHEGGSGASPRQTVPHAHSINVDPTNRYAFVPDLGQDSIVIYRMDLEQGKLVPNKAHTRCRVPPGSGPRHFCFHPSGQYAYVINEIGNTVTVFTYDAARGALAEIQDVNTLPMGFQGRSHTADVHVHPNGCTLYGSNRGHDSISTFAVDGATGRITLLGHESTQGQFPRNFGLDPTGSYLYAANQNSDNIAIYRIDAQTGLPVPTGEQVSVPVPVCIKMLPIV